MNSQITIVLIVFILFVIAILSGKIPMHLSALAIPIILEITGVLTTAEAWAGLSNSSVLMMASMFVVGAALGKTDVISRLSRTFIKAGAKDWQIMLGFFVTIFLLTLVVNGIATFTIILPIMYSVCREQNKAVSHFIYPVHILCMIWAGALPVGSGAAMYLQRNAIIEGLGGTGNWGFFDNLISMIPFLIILSLYAIFIAPRMMPDEETAPDVLAAAGRNDSNSSSLSAGKQKLAAWVFVGTLVAIILCALVGVATWYPAMIGAWVCVAFGLLDHKEAVQAMVTPIIWIFVGTLPLATALNKTGASDLIASWFNSVFGNFSGWGIMMSMYLMCAILTQFISNPAVSAAFMPLAALIAVKDGYDPRALMLAAIMGANNCWLLPTSGPLSLICYEKGGYSKKQFFKLGIPLFIIHAIIFAIYIPLVFKL
jgi:sodium-dependent dicarboxylate transporter 2/3/5